jgi:hypothetical protein
VRWSGRRRGTREAASFLIAYQLTGEGNAVDLVFAPGTVSNQPEFHREMEWASSFCRLIRFDKRGTGCRIVASMPLR